MLPRMKSADKGLVVLLAILCCAASARAHDQHGYRYSAITLAARPVSVNFVPGSRISGQGKMRFHVLYTASQLPDEALKVLTAAHGGFAVDRREGKGETYFALPGAGILQISADLKTIRRVDTPPEMKDVNLHSTRLWFAPDATPYLVFAANDAGKVFTTTLDGKLVNTLDAPTSEDGFDNPVVRDYFAGKGNFAPTGVEELEGLYYVTTGYSNLDFVLTARILSFAPFVAKWHDLAFGGKGNGPGQFQTGHAVTVPPGKKRLDIADRPNSRIERFTRYGHFLSELALPTGSLPCDISYLECYALVPCLDGPDRSKGAPLYILENDKLISTLMLKDELGLENFKHLHNAVMRKIGDRLYIIVQAWNPGDFAILEQTGE